MKYLFTVLILFIGFSANAQRTYGFGLNTGTNIVQTSEGFNKGVTTTLEASMIKYQDADFSYEFTLGTGYSSYYSNDAGARLKGINTYGLISFGDSEGIMVFGGGGYSSANVKIHMFGGLELRPFQWGPQNQWSVVLRGQIGSFLGLDPTVEQDNSDIYTTLTLGFKYIINPINAK